MVSKYICLSPILLQNMRNVLCTTLKSAEFGLIGYLLKHFRNFVTKRLIMNTLLVPHFILVKNQHLYCLSTQSTNERENKKYCRENVKVRNTLYCGSFPHLTCMRNASFSLAAAIQCLKKKKLYETQIEQLSNFQLRVHDQVTEDKILILITHFRSYKGLL
jgi:hypothetical protein